MNLLQKLQVNEQDFEWYPTTQEIIDLVHKSIDERSSILDIGAGDGRVLSSMVKKGTKYAIEKAPLLIDAMADDLIIVGTDFHASTLIDKKVDVIFCNPPYFDFKSWAARIIKEANAKYIYLVIPERWKESEEIKEAIALRKTKARVLGTFDFLNAERQARAKVDVLKISLQTKNTYGNYDELDVDPFDIWFNETFEQKKAGETFEDTREQETRWSEKISKSVTTGKGVIDVMVELYDVEMVHLYDNFKALSSLDPDLLKELDTDINNIKEALKSRISGLKNKYWKEVFDRMDEITSRLTTSTRRAMLDKLTGFISVEFTNDNVRAVLIWAIKNANNYYDSQLIDVMENLVSKSNIANYKSNQKTWQQSGWRYNRNSEEGKNNTHYKLELRIVRTGYCGIMPDGGYKFEHPNNLNKSAHDIINDIIVISNNLGYVIRCDSSRCIDGGFVYERSWRSNQTEEFKDSNSKVMMAVKAFKNGNLHIKFKKELICKLNVEFGRLKGWVNSPQEAAEEMDIDIITAKGSFNSSHQITNNNIKLLTS